jgi:hypothetical protein
LLLLSSLLLLVLLVVVAAAVVVTATVVGVLKVAMLVGVTEMAAAAVVGGFGTIFFKIKTYILSTDSIHIKLIGYRFKIIHHSHACNC